MSLKGIPTVDLALFTQGDPNQREMFVQQLGVAFHEVGFVAVSNHGIPKTLVDGFYAASKTFFALPEQTQI